MRIIFLSIFLLILLGAGAVKGQNKKKAGGGGNKGGTAAGKANKSIGKLVCKKDSVSPTFTGPMKTWMEKDCKPSTPDVPADPSSLTPEAMEQLLMKPMAGLIKCLLKKMGAMSKAGAPLRPKAVASFSSLFAGDQTKVQTAKSTIGKCFNQAGQTPKSDKDWASLSMCIVGFIETACITKEQLDAMMGTG